MKLKAKIGLWMIMVPLLVSLVWGIVALLTIEPWLGMLVIWLCIATAIMEFGS